MTDLLPRARARHAAAELAKSRKTGDDITFWTTETTPDGGWLVTLVTRDEAAGLGCRYAITVTAAMVATVTTATPFPLGGAR